MLPFIPASEESFVYSKEYLPEAMLVNALTVKKIITEQKFSSADNYISYALAVYYAGVVIAAFSLMVGTIRLFGIYRSGNKTQIGKWTIVETNQNHGPYSIFSILFISSRKNYSKEEFKILLEHEQAHSYLLHSADLLFIQLLGIIFWFHPLVYVYNYFIRLTHEYQADKAVKQSTSVYGKFLVEQSILNTSFHFTHSFNRSPIKNRILMLTKTKRSNKMKLIATLPLIIVCTLYFTKVAFAQKKEIANGKLNYKGNNIEFIEYTKDTVMVENPVTGDWQMMIAEKAPSPITLNGKRVFSDADKGIIPPSFVDKTSNMALDVYLTHQLSVSGINLPPSKYNYDVRSVLIDEKGNVVFFFEPEMRSDAQLSPDQKKQVADFAKETSKIIEGLKFEPAQFNGRPVSYTLSGIYLKGIEVIR
jgi:beta-lactamase regulating signal transducer with metallopeptidase domain